MPEMNQSFLDKLFQKLAFTIEVEQRTGKPTKAAQDEV